MPVLFEAPAKDTKSVQKPQKGKVKNVSSMGPLTCFAVNPTGVRFETQEDDEKVVLFLRQHLIVNVVWVLLTVLLIFAPTVVFPFILHFLPIPIQIPVRYILVSTLFWYLATFGFALASFLRWYFNIYIVTNQRIVDIDFVHLLFKQFSEAKLNKIQDLTYSSGGIFATIFNYGNVLVETAGEMPNIEFEAVPNPEKIVETISQLTKNM